jgi:hypothetical protein
VVTASVPKLKKKKKKDDPTRNRSRNSSQASSSSDSDEEEDEEEGEEEGEEEEGEEVEDETQNSTAAGRLDDENEAKQRGISDNPMVSPTSVAPTPTAHTAVLPRKLLRCSRLPPRISTPFSLGFIMLISWEYNFIGPVLKRRSSSQADSTDGSDSD